MQIFFIKICEHVLANKKKRFIRKIMSKGKSICYGHSSAL